MGFVHGHIRHELFEHFVHDGLGFADGETSDAVARKIHIGKHLRALDAEIAEHTSLHDAEQSLILPCMACFAAFRPTMGAVHCGGGIAFIAVSRRTFIKCHGDIGTERLLYLHHIFGGKKELSAVDMGMEFNAVLANLIHCRKAEYLKAAAVGEHGAMPL